MAVQRNMVLKDAARDAQKDRCEWNQEPLVVRSIFSGAPRGTKTKGIKVYLCTVPVRSRTVSDPNTIAR